MVYVDGLCWLVLFKILKRWTGKSEENTNEFIPASVCLAKRQRSKRLRLLRLVNFQLLCTCQMNQKSKVNSPIFPGFLHNSK
jgi:hypothetical protein